MNFYRQCRMSKGPASQVAFIPEPFARIGRFVRLLDDDGWRVDSVGRRVSDQWLTEKHRADRHQREASDI